MTALEVEPSVDPDQDEDEEDINDRETWVLVEIDQLYGTDWPDRIAERLGYRDATALGDALKRWGHHDVAVKFMRVAFDGMVSPATLTKWDQERGAHW